jgi:hypothetical protein
MATARQGLMGLGLLASIGVAGCTSSSAVSPPAAVTSQPTSSAAVAPSSAPTPTVSPTPTPSSGISNLVVTAATRSALTTAYAAYKGISPAYIAGTRPGSVYDAFNPATDTYWAMATFEATATAPMNVTVNFQDGGDIGFFTKVGSGTWKVQLGGEPAECTELRFYPQAVLTAWSLPTSPPTTPPGANPVC